MNHPPVITTMLLALNLICTVSFLGYGFSCLASERMAREFERFGLAKFRRLTGALQLLGGAGLIVGFQLPVVGAIAAGGLALQMLLGFGVRLKIRDRLVLCLPALIYLVLCALLCSLYLAKIFR